MGAADNGRIDCLRVLLEAGADKGTTDKVCEMCEMQA